MLAHPEHLLDTGSGLGPASPGITGQPHGPQEDGGTDDRGASTGQGNVMLHPCMCVGEHATCLFRVTQSGN